MQSQTKGLVWYFDSHEAIKRVHECLGCVDVRSWLARRSDFLKVQKYFRDTHQNTLETLGPNYSSCRSENQEQTGIKPGDKKRKIRKSGAKLLD